MPLTILPNEPRLNTLALIASFGYLTTREIAQLGWPTSAPKTGLNLAQKYCSEMAKDGLLLARELPHVSNAKAYVLTGKGARLLERELLQLWPRDGYDLELERVSAQRPVIELAAHLCRERGFDVVGGRGLVHGAFDLGAFKGLDALMVDEYQMPLFGILQVRFFDKPTIARIKKFCKLPVPILLAGTNEKVLQALLRERAKIAPQHEEHIENNCGGALC